MQGRSGARLPQKTHVLCLDEQAVPCCCAVNEVRQLQPPSKRGQCVLDAHHVVTRVEVADVVAFPRIGATPPKLDG
jgi:hypothetical protein